LPTLHILYGPDKGRTFELTEQAIVIGRTSEQLALSDVSSSRRHAELRPANGSWVLSDLNSSNGTYVNGQRIAGPTKLHYGDQIKIGNTLLVLGGANEVQSVTGPDAIRGLVDIDLDGDSGATSILAAVGAVEDPALLQPPPSSPAGPAWNMVFQIAEAIGTIDSVDAFLHRIVDIVFGQLETDRLLLLMYDGPSGELVPRVVRFRSGNKGQRTRIATSKAIINHVVQTRGGVLSANALTDARFTSQDLQDSVHQLGPCSVICVPIIAHDEVLGVLHLDCSMARFTYTQEHLRLAVAIGRLTGMAMENRRLLESRVRTERLAATGETVAFLSHHIRNILQGLQGGADVVDVGLRKSDMQVIRSGWSLVSRNLDRIYQLVLNMLTFSKQRRPSIETAQLNEIVDDVLSLVKRGAEEKVVTVTADLATIPPLPLDPEGMHQVVHNIVLNAIAAAPPTTGKVTVSTRHDAESSSVLLSVSDNGPGIPESARAAVFEPFHSSKGHSGTGLGLTAAKKIVDELGGTIDVRNARGSGAILEIRLPEQPKEIPAEDEGTRATHPDPTSLADPNEQ